MKKGIEFHEYYERYINLAAQVSLPTSLENGLEETVRYFKDMPDSLHEYCYEEGKWTPKEILLHIIDTERVFAYRGLQFARASNVVLEGFDQDEFAENAQPVMRNMESLISEFEAVRNSSIAFVKSCSDVTLQRIGVASNSPLSVRAAFRIICGHEIHHINIINERYIK